MSKVWDQTVTHCIFSFVDSAEQLASLGTIGTNAVTPGARESPTEKWKHELGHSTANTKIGPHCIGGGNKKYCALRLDTWNFSWSSKFVYAKKDY